MQGTGLWVVLPASGGEITRRTTLDRWRSGALARRLLAALCLLGLSVSPSQPVYAAPPGQGIFDSSAREEAARTIPFDQLNEPARAKVWEVVSRPSVFRRFPTQVIESDPEFYVFLVRYPEVIVSMWQLMGVTKVQVKRKGAYTFDATDGAGTTSSVELVYGRPDLHVFYADGLYEGPLLHRRVDGNCVLLLRSTFTKRNERTYVTCNLDAFVRVNDMGTELVAKTLQPIVGKAVDNNFLESLKFLGQVSQATETNGPGMQLLAGRMNSLDDAVRQTFIQHVEAVYQKAVLRNHQRSSAWSQPAPAEAPRPASGVASPASQTVLEPVPPARLPKLRR